MEQLGKAEYNRMVESGFKPKYPVKKTSHGRFHYVVESDYYNYLKYMENKKKEN